MRFIQAQKRLALYFSLLSVVGMTLVFLVTHRYGPGMSTDGARYLSTAQNLIEGRGFYDYLNVPLTQFPPLYPILIAGISLITGVDVFVAGQYLNILTFGVVIWLSGYFFYRIFPGDALIPYFGSAIFATSLSLILIASNILSDLLFLAFTLAFLIAATNVLERGTWQSIFLMGLFAAISPLQRYAGLALILTGATLVLFLYRRNPVRAVLLAGVFGVLTGLPIFLWVFFHNYLPTGILFGKHMPSMFLGNLQITLEKVEHWFLPATLTNLIPLWAIVTLILLVITAGNRLTDWKRWLAQLTSAHFLPSLVFFIFYLYMLVFNVSYYEHRYLYMDRIHIVILPALLALIFVTIRELTPAYLQKLFSRKLQLISILVFLIWLIFPIYNIQKYMKRAFYEGEISEFNLYNIPVLRDSGVKEFLALHPVTGSQKVYSNYEAAAWFLTRHPITKLPFADVSTKKIKNPEEILQRFPTWPEKDGAGYVIWIKALTFKPYVLQPDQLTGRADFQLLQSNKEADIYLLTPK